MLPFHTFIFFHLLQFFRISASSASTNNFMESITKPENYNKIVEDAKGAMQDPNAIEIDERPYEFFEGRGASSNKRHKWDNQMIVIIDPKFTNEERQKVLSAIYTLKKAMKCFDFQVVREGGVYPKLKDSLAIIKDDDINNCYSLLGKQRGRQLLFLSAYSCNLYGSGMHEIMHALGFYHEQTRKDRDKFITIDPKKFSSRSDAAQYAIDYRQRHLVTEYDFDSILHYRFNKVMKPKSGKVPLGIHVGQRSHLSKLDIERLNKFYTC